MASDGDVPFCGNNSFSFKFFRNSNYKKFQFFNHQVVVTSIGTSSIGPGEVFNRALDGGRLNFFKYSSV